MKKFMKFCAITAAILIALGFLIAIPSAAIQGTSSISKIVKEKTNGKVKVKLNNLSDWGVQIGEEVTDIVGSSEFEAYYNIEDSMTFEKGIDILSGNQERTFESVGIDSLILDAGGCEITIKPSPDVNFHVETEAIQKFQGYTKDNVLYIKGGSSGKTFVNGSSLKTGEIVLYVPEGFVFDEVSIDLGAGSLELGDLNASKLCLEVGAGEISCEGMVRSESAEMKVGMGEIDAKQMEVGKLTAEVGMGTFEMAGKITEEADLDCSMGSIRMELAGSAKDYNFDLESALGDVTVGDYSASGITGDKKLQNDASCDITLKCSMGSIEISFEE